LPACSLNTNFISRLFNNVLAVSDRFTTSWDNGILSL
jgi:hypothetical protein